jgi:hypothetical protein
MQGIVLPAPDRDFNVQVPICWPKEVVLDGTWKPSAVKMAR